MATAPARSPDPSLTYGATAVVRRLAPNSRKIDFAKVDKRLHARVVAAMAQELATVHGETTALRARIIKALEALPADWLVAATRRVVEWTEQEFAAYSRAYARGALER